jgi:hypothetical protein
MILNVVSQSTQYGTTVMTMKVKLGETKLARANINKDVGKISMRYCLSLNNSAQPTINAYKYTIDLTYVEISQEEAIMASIRSKKPPILIF